MPHEAIRGRTWVTRAGAQIDRLASAWFIRRFVDPAARFHFVDPDAYEHAAGHVRFDMFDGEFTHDGDRCTFEVLVQRFGAEDPGLQAIGEIVHDVDLKDERFGRPETVGLAQMIEGVILDNPDDAKRIAAATPLFDALYARLGAR